MSHPHPLLSAIHVAVERPAPPDPLCLACAPGDRGRSDPCHRVDGLGRVACAALRLERAKAMAQPSPLVSPLVHPSPARGPMKVLRQTETILTASGPRQRPATADGFHAASRADSFDLMLRQAKRRKPDAPDPFTVAQVVAGRAYGALAERCAAEGVRCSSFDRRIPGISERDWIEGVIARSARLARMQAAIGDDVVLDASGVRAHADRGRRTIRARALVDQVCSGGQTLSAVLRRHGWSARTDAIATLRLGLTRALDRLWGL